ncbi:TRAP transporter large permease [Pseudaminobacter salicylatoxidans]|uniref:TRAP transporter large permease n=1 Tax=Pseudaminobacter salicylatoxidans TaxID=93369 RepID=UPI0003145A1F|nr:TRAP transporter large permease [Pseudaminobacter salicylatoxidans]
MDPVTLSLVVSLGLLVLLLGAGVHIGAALALVGIIGSYVFLGSWTAGLNLLLLHAVDISSSYTMMVIPLFILMGGIASASGITKDLFNLFYRSFGRLPGGVAVATVGTCAGMAAITGSSVATSAAMSRIALPELRRFAYDERMSTGAIATGGTLSIMIPPSITLVLYAIFAQQSVGKMLIAGVLPGMLLALGYILLIVIRCRINPRLGPPGPRFSFRERVELLPGVLPFLLVIAAVIAGILFGIWTPVESAAVAVLLVTAISVLQGRLGLRQFVDACREAVNMSASVFIVVIGSMVFSGFLALNGFSDMIADSILAMNLTPFALLLLLVAIYIVLGMFMEVSSLLALTIPLVMPIVLTVGWNPIWFGVVVVSLMEVAAVTPPVGLNLYAVKASVPSISLKTIYVGSVQFWLINILLILVLFAFPDIALILPNMQ